MNLNLTACSDYQPQKLDKGAAIDENSTINARLINSPQLIPNQFPEVQLAVDSLDNLDVSGVVISGIISINAATSRAEFSAETITFDVNSNKQSLPLRGFAFDPDNQIGMRVRCIKNLEEQCGLFEFVNKGANWNINTLEATSLKGISMMVKSS